MYYINGLLHIDNILFVCLVILHSFTISIYVFNFFLIVWYFVSTVVSSLSIIIDEELIIVATLHHTP